MPPPTLSALLRGQLQLHMTTTPLFQGVGIEDISLHDGLLASSAPYKDQFFDSGAGIAFGASRFSIAFRAPSGATSS